MRDKMKLIEAALQNLEKGVPALELDGKLLITTCEILIEMVCDIGIITDYLIAIIKEVAEMQQKPY